MNLRDALELILDRILDGQDLVFRRLDLGQTGIERRRLARSRWTGHQHHPVGLADELVQLADGLLVEAQNVESEILELLTQRLLVENADHTVLAMDRRHHRDAEVDRATLKPQLEAPILRYALFGDVELGHDLDPADDRLMVLPIDRLHRLVEHAINAVLDDDLTLPGLSFI